MPRLPGPEQLGGVSFSTRAGIPAGDAGGAAIAGAVMRLGNTLQAIGEDRAKERVQNIEFDAQASYLQFEDQWNREAVRRAENAQPGAAGYMEGLGKDFGKARERFLSSLPLLLRKQYEPKIIAYEARLAGKARTFEREETDRYSKVKLADAQNALLNSQAADPSKWQEVEKEGEALIRSRPGASAIEIDDEARAWRKRRALQLFETRRARDEAGARAGLGVGATAGDIPPEGRALLDTIAGTESPGYNVLNGGERFSSFADHPRRRGAGGTTTAAGRYQFVKGTWDRARNATGVPDFSPASQDKAAWWLAQADYKLRTGRDLLADLRSGSPIVQASVRRVLSSTWEGLKYLDDKRFVDKLAAGPTSAGGADISILTDPAPEYAALDFETRLKLYEQSLGEERARTRSAIDLATTNAPAAIMATGSYSGAIPTAEQFSIAYGVDGPEKYASFQQAVETSRTAFDMQTMPAEEIRATVAAAEPTSSGNDAALQAERYRVISGAADATLKARAADPAAYVQRAFPSVAAAWQEAGQAGGYQAAISASVAAQHQLGIEDVRPLPAPVAEQAVEGFKDQQARQDERLASVGSVLMATDDPQQRRAIFEQMVEAGLPEQMQGVMLALERGDKAAADRLFLAAVVNPSDLPGKLPDDMTPARIDRNIQDAIMAEGKIGDIYYGLSDGSAEDFIPARRDNKLLVNSVNLRMRAGETMEGAIRGAARDLYGDVRPVTAPNARILVPDGTDSDEVLAGLDSMMPNVREAIEAFVPMPELSGSSKAVVEAARQNEIDAIMARGYFRNSGNDFVFVDPVTGTIPDVNGEPLLFGVWLIKPPADEPRRSEIPEGVGIRDALMGTDQ
jgi:muramidase (phage lysozyme)